MRNSRYWSMKSYTLIALVFVLLSLHSTDARVTYYLANVLPTDFNSTSSVTNAYWRGNAIAELHTVGAVSLNATRRSLPDAESRLKLICFHNIDEDVTKAWLNDDTNNVSFSRLYISKTLTAVSLNVVLNKSQEALLHSEALSIYIATTSYPKGALSGTLQARPYQYASFLQSQVNISSNKNVSSYNGSTVEGFAVAQVLSESLKNPIDFSNSSTFFETDLRLSSVVIHTIDSAFSGDIRSNTSVFAFNIAFDALSFDDVSMQITALEGFESKEANVSIYLQQDLNSTISFGNFTSLLVSRASRLPVSIALKNGILRGDPRSMQKQQLTGTDNNSSLCVWMIPGNGGILEATLHFNFPIARKNIRIIRGLALEVNMWGPQNTGQNWTFEYYNQVSGSWDTIGYYTGSDEWTRTDMLLQGNEVVPYLHPIYSSLIMRIKSVGEDALLFDQLTIKAWIQNPEFTAMARPYMFFY